MIERIIDWSLRNRFLVFCAALFLMAWGVRAIRQTPVDAIPDLSENQVIVFADWMGRSPKEVEDQVTYHLSATLQGLAGVKTVRAVSMFRLSAGGAPSAVVPPTSCEPDVAPRVRAAMACSDLDVGSESSASRES